MNKPKLVSKWLDVKSLCYEEDDKVPEVVRPVYEDPLLRALTEQADAEEEKLIFIFNPINMDEIQSIHPRAEEGQTTIKFINGSSCIVDMDVHEVYKKLLEREKYTEEYGLFLREK